MEARTAAHELPRPKSIEEVDAWMANYLALMDAARAEALRVKRLHDAAPDLVKALQDLCNAVDSCVDLTPEVMAQAHAALAKAGV